MARILLMLLVGSLWAGGHARERDPQNPACAGQALPSPHCGRAPSPAFAADGRVWIAFSQNGHVYLTHSEDQGRTLAPPVAVNRIPEPIFDDGENRPKVALGPGGEIYLSWSVQKPGKYAGDVRFARSLDGGGHFDPPITVNDDDAPISHRFDALTVDGQGRITLVWLDKRDLAAAQARGESYEGAGLYYAMSDNRGEGFAFNRKVADHTCECCRVATALDEAGRVAVLWRHVFPGQIRDHALAWLTPDPRYVPPWPLRATFDDWRLDGCPHHGPSLAVGREGVLHLVWFGMGERRKGLTYGRFHPSRGVLEGEKSVDDAPGAMHPQVLARGDRVGLVWTSFGEGKTVLWAMTSRDGGEHWSPPVALAEDKGGGDHPQLLAHGERIFVSWQGDASGYRLLPLPGDR